MAKTSLPSWRDVERAVDTLLASGDIDLLLRRIGEDSLRSRYRPPHMREQFVRDFCRDGGSPILLPRSPMATWAEQTRARPEDYGLPPLKRGLRDLFSDMAVSKAVTRAIVKAPRGGGKTQIASVIELVLWLLDDYDWINLGGSERQARQLYGYIQFFLEDNPALTPKERTGLITKSIQEETTSSTGAWLKVLTASTKAVRGPHAGGPTKGGGLTLDEEMETEEDIVEAAKWTINTAVPATILRTSTFHKTHGTFQAVWDESRERGYTQYEWDIFDICQPCPYTCAAPWVPPAGVELPTLPDQPGSVYTGQGQHCPVLDFIRDYVYTGDEGEESTIHRAYCGGKARYAEGWIPVGNIVDMWNDTDRATFEVEGMGWRPSSSGLVIKDRDALDRVFYDGEPPVAPGEPGVVAIDWGLQGECAVGALQFIDGDIWLVDYDHYTGVPDTTIYQVVRQMTRAIKTREVNGDASHPYCNLNLRRPPYRLKVRGVNFSTAKELGVGNINKWVESGRFHIPVGWRDPAKAQRFNKLRLQLVNWRRDKNGKIVKKDDHGPDMLLCGLLKWLREKVATGEQAQAMATDSHEFNPRQADEGVPIMDSLETAAPATPKPKPAAPPVSPDEAWAPRMVE